ncbi:50S ribosomal protein L10 [Desulfobotulus mexicanus]|uniref:Large ribosomal subunit protein uL10 n=1 Tax=Desulfobotulus mexicanus TaxID=2586642 RepID=A0A5Q4VCT3_9BACT|nr:50S ribosomal protein L10 [Desulfobotulus mexicanus]TYT74778.1 50S ribosomal protein L10 [Desulfobotulus mexicanus]
MKLSEKEALVQKLHEGLASAQIAIVADYKGLNVEQFSRLRRELREAGAEIQVVKNTLLRRASEGTRVDVIRDHFKGPSAICFSTTDPVLPAKVLTKFAEANDKLEIRVAVLEGKPLGLADLKALSELPSREELLAQVLSTMIAVPTGFVRVINAVPSGLVNVLTAIKDQKEAA